MSLERSGEGDGCRPAVTRHIPLYLDPSIRPVAESASVVAALMVAFGTDMPVTARTVDRQATVATLTLVTVVVGVRSIHCRAGEEGHDEKCETRTCNARDRTHRTAF